MKITFLGNFQVPFSSENHHKKSLEALGHQVIAMQETQASSDHILKQALDSQMFVWVHTHGWETPGDLKMADLLYMLKRQGIPSVTYHLDLWLGLERQKDLDNDPVYRNIEHFFTVDKSMAEWFSSNTEVKGHYLPAGVYHEECYLAPQTASHDIIFVGSKHYHPEWPYRPQLINWLQQTYGNRFQHYGGDGLGVVRGAELNQLYANTKIAIGDSLSKGFDYPYYYSDRIFETTGRGGFIIHPYIKGLEECFEIDKEIITYDFGNFEQLKDKIDYYLVNDMEREAIRIAGHLRTKKHHTYLERWKIILETIDGSNS